MTDYSANNRLESLLRMVVAVLFAFAAVSWLLVYFSPGMVVIALTLTVLGAAFAVVSGAIEYVG